MKIAILGATSHIAKNIVYHFQDEPQVSLFLYARDQGAVHAFLRAIGGRSAAVGGFDAFQFSAYDLIVNCVGIADPRKQAEAGIDLFHLTEHFDNLVIDYLANHEETVYINFSSGAVYGTTFDVGVTEDSIANIVVNDISPTDYYRIAKLNAEAKHRAMPDRRIIDLRIFSFFSRFIDLSSRFLVSEMVRSVAKHQAFVTRRDDVVRDYVAPADLCDLLTTCAESKGVNKAVDVYSLSPVSKSQLIETFVERYGMKVTYTNEDPSDSPTGYKNQYYSLSRKAEHCFCYKPRFSSLDTVIEGADAFLDVLPRK